MLESDLSIMPSMIMFGPNDTSRTITVVANDDDILEYNESFTVSFNNTDELLDIGVLVGENLTVTIIDNDGTNLFCDYTINHAVF